MLINTNKKILATIILLAFACNFLACYAQELEVMGGLKDSPQQKIKLLEPPVGIELEPFSEEFSEQLKKDVEFTEEDLKKALTETLEYELIPISLGDCIRIAMENNFDIKAIIAVSEAQDWFKKRSQTRFLPNLSYNYSVTRVNGTFLIGGVIPVSIVETPIESNFRLDWDIFTGFQRWFNYKRAKFEYLSAEENVEFQKQAILFDVAREYYELLGDKIAIKILTINLKQVRAQLRINKAKFEAGNGTRFDVLRAEAEEANSVQLLINSYNSFRLRQAKLANVIGLNVFTPLFPVDEEIESKMLVDEVCTVDELGEIAIRERPDIESARFQYKKTEAEKNAAKSIYLPRITLRAQIADQGSAAEGLSTNRAIALLARWDGLTGLGFFGYTNIKGLDRLVEKSRLDVIIKERDVRENVIGAFYQSLAAKKRVEAAEKGVVSANESLRLAFIRLNVGIGIFVDVLQAQVSATTAKIRLLEAVIDYNVAQAKILFETGLISPNNVLQGVGEK